MGLIFAKIRDASSFVTFRAARIDTSLSPCLDSLGLRSCPLFSRRHTMCRGTPVFSRTQVMNSASGLAAGPSGRMGLAAVARGGRSQRRTGSARISRRGDKSIGDLTCI